MVTRRLHVPAGGVGPLTASNGQETPGSSPLAGRSIRGGWRRRRADPAADHRRLFICFIIFLVLTFIMPVPRKAGKTACRGGGSRARGGRTWAASGSLCTVTGSGFFNIPVWCHFVTFWLIFFACPQDESEEHDQFGSDQISLDQIRSKQLVHK